MDLSQFMDRLQYRFQDESLLSMAITHPSYGAEHDAPHYQRLEFLGDAVLELAVSQDLYRHQTDLSEGKLTRVRAALVREESLFEAGAALGIADVVRLSAGEERSGGRGKPSILSDVLEAIVGAVFLDGGLDEACNLVYRALGDRLRHVTIEEDPLDYKTRLQEAVQSAGLPTPTYEQIRQGGEPHRPHFEMRVLSGDREIGTGAGRSKRAAQQQAAKDALSRM